MVQGFIENVKLEPYRYASLFTGVIGSSLLYEDVLGYSVLGRKHVPSFNGKEFTQDEVMNFLNNKPTNEESDDPMV